MLKVPVGAMVVVVALLLLLLLPTMMALLQMTLTAVEQEINFAVQAQ